MAPLCLGRNHAEPSIWVLTGHLLWLWPLVRTSCGPTHLVKADNSEAYVIYGQAALSSLPQLLETLELQQSCSSWHRDAGQPCLPMVGTFCSFFFQLMGDKHLPDLATSCAMLKARVYYMYGAGHFSLPAWLAGAFSRTFAGTRQPEQCLHFTLCWLLAVAFLLELTSLFFFYFPPRGCSEHLHSLHEINKWPCLFAVRWPIHLWWSCEESPRANGAGTVLCIPTGGTSLALLCTTHLYVLVEIPGLCLLLSAHSAPRAAVIQAPSSLFCRS